MRNFILVVSIAVVVPTVAKATRWVPVSTTSEASRYVDADEFLFENATATIWLKTKYSSKGKKGEALAIEKWMHDCANSRSKVLALTLYNAKGDVISSAELPRYRLEWGAIIPGSVGEVIHKRVCGIVNGPAEGRHPDRIDFENVS